MFQECLGSPPSSLRLLLLRMSRLASLVTVTVPGTSLEMMRPHRQMPTMSTPPTSAWSPPDMAKAFMSQVLTRGKTPSVLGLRRFPLFAAGLMPTSTSVPSAAIQAFMRPSRSLQKTINPFMTLCSFLWDRLSLSLMPHRTWRPSSRSF